MRSTQNRTGNRVMAEWPYSTANWQRLRRRKLSADPLCYPCQLRGRIVAADTIDHVKAIADGGHPFPDLDGLMSMCARCHNEKTRAQDHPTSKASGRRFKGFDGSGNGTPTAAPSTSTNSPAGHVSAAWT